MQAFYLLLYVVALVLFGMAALNIAVRKFDAIAGGLFFLTLVLVLQTVEKL